MNKKVKVAANVFLQQVDDETILLDTLTEEYFSLDEVGTMFYKMLQEEESLEVVAQELAENFDVAQEVIAKDLSAFVQALQEKGLVEII